MPQKKEEKFCPKPEIRILENAGFSKGILSAEDSLLKCRLKYEIRFTVIENKKVTLS